MNEHLSRAMRQSGAAPALMQRSAVRITSTWVSSSLMEGRSRDFHSAGHHFISGCTEKKRVTKEARFV